MTDWYAGGVVATCRWLACATVRPSDGPWFRAPSPVTRRQAAAFEELIEAEYRAAELLAELQPDLAAAGPGWCESIGASLRWAWRHSAPRPLGLRSSAGRVG